MNAPFDPRVVVWYTGLMFAILFALTWVRCRFSRYKNERYWNIAWFMVNCAFVVCLSSVVYANVYGEKELQLDEFTFRLLITVYTILFLTLGNINNLFQTFFESDKTKRKRIEHF